MPRLLLIRHGSNDFLGRELVGRRPGVHLNDQGRAEADALAEALSGWAIVALHSSPRERALETAAPLGRRLGLAPRVEAALDEVDFGDWTGRSLDDLASDPLWQRFNRDRALTRVPRGETMAEVAARMARFMDVAAAAAAAQGDDCIALVGHGDPIRAGICQAVGLPIDFMLRFEVAPASLTVLRVGRGAVLLERLNDCSHIRPVERNATGGSASR
jgi:probable phosphoglycerate mutase